MLSFVSLSGCFHKFILLPIKNMDNFMLLCAIAELIIIITVISVALYLTNKGERCVRPCWQDTALQINNNVYIITAGSQTNVIKGLGGGGGGGH